MNSPKRENLLNLALDATPRERQKSLELDVGYSAADHTWEVIVKYSGNLSQIEEIYPEIEVVELSNEYAIVTLPETLMDFLTNRVEVEFIEKPKRLFFALSQAIRVSCITPLYGTNFGLTGSGTLIAVIDSGIDYRHPDFINADGTTRIAALWDQTITPQGDWQPPDDYRRGVEFTSEQINLALQEPTAEAGYKICPSRDYSGHGTHVAGIAAGNGRASNGENRGVAFKSQLLIVKLGFARENSFPRTTELMMAVDYVIKKARDLSMPLTVNLSFGNNNGSHDGTSLLETYLSDISNYWKTSIVVGTGNEGVARGHTSGTMSKTLANIDVELLVGTYETSINLQLWKSYVDTVGLSIIHPNGTLVGTIRAIQGTQRFTILNTKLLTYYGEPSPFNPYQEIYIDFIPTGTYIDSGVWTIRIQPERVVYGNFNMWIPSAGVLNTATGFLTPVENTTLTIPSTAAKVISVGAYDSYYDQYASFSGRGFTRQTNQVKPDLSAPGVDILSTVPGGGYAAQTGTSMATPFVSGVSSLFMEWGIVRGNDPYLYGEKMKAYLIKGARHLPAFTEYPNPQLGWGVLCARDSLPV